MPEVRIMQILRYGVALVLGFLAVVAAAIALTAITPKGVTWTGT